jgi:hypothetical protein
LDTWRWFALLLGGIIVFYVPIQAYARQVARKLQTTYNFSQSTKTRIWSIMIAYGICYPIFIAVVLSGWLSTLGITGVIYWAIPVALGWFYLGYIWSRTSVLTTNPTILCPCCKLPLPAKRKPTSLSQTLWGGWTCSNCGCEIDKDGKMLNGHIV